MILKKCEICNNSNLIKVLNLGLHPLCDDLKPIGSKKTNKKYKIEILFCKNCSTAYQKYNVNKKLLFHKDYHYRAKHTKDVLDGMQSLVNDCKKKIRKLKNKTVLDVGCNDGSLLNLFKKEKTITIGIEPTDASKDINKTKHKIFQSYVDNKTITKIKKKYGKIDIITFTNVFAHIENLRYLLKNIQKLLSNETILIIENHYLGSVLKKSQFDTFYHEHPRTYSLKSFIKIANYMDLQIINYSFPKRYGGNIRIMLSKKFKKKKINSKILSNEEKFLKDFNNLNKKIKIWRVKKIKIINNLVSRYGALPAKAFPGRAAILIKILNLNNNHISSIYEKEGSNKIGYYAPSTKIPIISDQKLKNINKKIPIINLAWHIKKEIKSYLKKNKIYNKVLNIIDNDDFKR